MSNKKSYRKYGVATMAAAAAVASVAPVAISADETKSFTDVNSNHDFYDEITDLTSEGLITGYEDGTFRPSAPIRRVSVANMIHRDLGLEVPKDLDAELDKYVDAKAGDEYDTVIGAVSQAGILTGNQKDQFNPWKDITREQMASVLYRAYDLGQYEADHVEINLKGVDDSHKKAVQTLANLGITQGTALNDFEPLKPITRGQFAAQQHRTLEVVNAPEEEVAPVVEGVSAINAKQIEVTFSQAVGTNAGDPDNYNVRELAGGAENDVKKVNFKDDHTVILTLENEYRVSTDVVVTVEGIFIGDSIKDKFPKFSDVITVHDTVAPTIESVTANVTSTGASQEITVTLSEPIKTGATFRVNGKTVQAVPTGAGDAGLDTVYAITSQNLDVDKTHELEILNAEDYADNKVSSLTSSFTIEKDTTEATGKVTAAGDNKIKVSFDKAVVPGTLTNVQFLTYNGSEYVTTSTVGSATPASKDGKDWIFTLDATGFYNTNDNTEEILVKAGTNIIDTAGNPIKAFEEKVTLTEDSTGPIFEGVTFDKNSKGEVTKLYLEYNEQLATVFDSLNDIDVLQTYIQAADGSLDVDNAIDVDAAKVDDYFKLVNKKTNDDTIVFTDVFGTPDSIKLASDGKTVVVDLDLANNAAAKKVTEGNYGLTAVKGFVLDTAYAENASSKVTKDLNIAAESNVVKATVATSNAWTTVPADDEAVAGDNKFTVEFNQPVTEASAKNPANYKFNDKALPEDTVIKVNPTADEVEFELPSGYIAVDEEDAKLTITNIKPKDSSATFESYLDTEVVLDNTAPEAKGEIVGSGEIYLTFSEAVDIADADFTNTKAKVFINGLELTGTTVAFDDGVLSSTPGNTDDAIKITVNAETLANTDSGNETGFSYLYIDVDGDGKFDTDKDIILSQVKGAPASDWTNVANLNNSVIKTVEVKTQDGDNATEDESFLKNKLESNFIVKVK